MAAFVFIAVIIIPFPTSCQSEILGLDNESDVPPDVQGHITPRNEAIKASYLQAIEPPAKRDLILESRQLRCPSGYGLCSGIPLKVPF